jgi:hypothetical protein
VSERGSLVRPVSSELLKRLRIADAVESEARSWQNTIPQMPGLELIEQQRTLVAEWLGGQLRSGLRVAPGLVLAARKHPHGMRAVPIWGLAERVAFRALTEFLLRGRAELDRSSAAYLEFLGGPLDYARDVDQSDELTIILVGSASVKYVVKSDVVAFYDHIDHGLRGDELLSIGGDYEAVECLLSRLEEGQGRAYGLPQMLDPSDDLSDLYIERVQRAVVRRGWPTWRFNDAFRIAVEDLSAAARDAGLTLSDFKTTTPKFERYALQTFGLQVDQALPEELALHEPEDFVADYTEGVGEEDNEWAVRTLERVVVDAADADADSIDLADLSTAGFRALRRALTRLIRHPAPGALIHIQAIVGFVPALTPWALRVVSALGDVGQDESAQAETLVRDLVGDSQGSDWQRVWMLRTIGDLQLLTDDQDELCQWVLDSLRGGHSPAVVAEALLALARANRVSFEDLERSVFELPDVLRPWYLAAVRSLLSHGSVSEQQLAAARGDSVLDAVLIP